MWTFKIHDVLKPSKGYFAISEAAVPLVNKSIVLAVRQHP
jgi:hypothetical protein